MQYDEKKPSHALAEPGPGSRFYTSLTGPGAVALRVPVFKGVRSRGIRLCPGALRAFLGLDVALIVGKSIAVETILPDCDAALRSGLSPLPHALAEFSVKAEQLFAERAQHTDELDNGRKHGAFGMAGGRYV